MKPSLEISDDIVLDMGIDKAWELVTDPHVVVGCVPGAEIISTKEDGTIVGALVLSLGPNTTRFEGRITPTFDHAEHSGRLEGQGGDGRGRTRASITTVFQLDNTATDKTRMSITSSVTIGGALAGFAMTGGKAMAQQLLEDFAQNIGNLGTERTVEYRQPDTAASSKPPSNGLGVARLFWKSMKNVIGRLFRSDRA